MSYATQQSLIDRYGEAELIALTDKATPPTGAIVATVVDRALADADAIIDSYAAARYLTPMTPTPAVVVGVACVIARYKLHEDHATELIRRDYETALTWLRDVAAGRAQIVGALAPGASASGTFSAIAVGAPAQVFTDALMETMP